MIETATSELTYDPYATIVISDSDYYTTVNPKTVQASEITSTYRNDKIRTQQIVKRNQQIEDVRMYLIENYEELEEHADEIAKLLDIELSKSVEFTMSVTVTGTMSVPVGKDISDLDEYDFDIEVEYNDSDFDLEDVDVNINHIRES